MIKGKPTRIAITGSSGRMGRMLLEAVAQDGNAVLAAALELAGHSIGFGGRSAGRRVAGEDRHVFFEEHDRRDDRRLAAETRDVDAPVASDRCCCVRRSEVDSQ